MLGGLVLPPVIAFVSRNGTAALAGSVWTVVKGGSGPFWFFAYFSSWCYPSTPRTVGREYSVESKFGCKQGELAPGCRWFASCSGPHMPAVPQDVALAHSSHHPLPELPLVMAAGAQVGWQSGSHAAGTEGTWKRQRRAGREKEGRRRVSDKEVVISTWHSSPRSYRGRSPSLSLFYRQGN